MSANPRETDSSKRWATMEIRPCIDEQQVGIYKEVTGRSKDPRLHNLLADSFRNDYLEALGDKNFDLALHHYDVSLQHIGDNPTMLAVVLCGRLQLYAYEHEMG